MGECVARGFYILWGGTGYDRIWLGSLQIPKHDGVLPSLISEYDDGTSRLWQGGTCRDVGPLVRGPVPAVPEVRSAVRGAVRSSDSSSGRPDPLSSHRDSSPSQSRGSGRLTEFGGLLVFKKLDTACSSASTHRIPVIPSNNFYFIDFREIRMKLKRMLLRYYPPGMRGHVT